MGMEQDETPMTIPPPTPPPAPYPIIPKSPLQKPPHKAILYPLPFRITPTPMDCPYAASAAKLERMQEDIAVEFLTIGGEDCKSTFQQIYLSPHPYFDAFEEQLDIRRWHTNDHPTAGLRLIEEDQRVFVHTMESSTPASRIPRWRSRIKGAWLMQVGTMPIHTIKDVRDALKMASTQRRQFCPLLLAHPEIRDGLTSDGIPQVNIDQLNTRFFINNNYIATQQAPVVASGGVYNYAFSKLTPGKLIKQPDWHEWQQSEFLQLDQYQQQLMFGTPTQVTDRSQVFHLVWTYNIKDLDKRKKARCACDGSTRGGKVRLLDYTYANCVDHTASRMFYAILAARKSPHIWSRRLQCI